jgi:hypothetical protein
MKDIIFDKPETFIEQLASDGISTVVIALVNEKRTVETEPGTIHVEKIRRADFIAYRKSTIYKFTASDSMIDETERALTGRGISCAARDRNIT